MIQPAQIRDNIRFQRLPNRVQEQQNLIDRPNPNPPQNPSSTGGLSIQSIFSDLNRKVIAPAISSVLQGMNWLHTQYHRSIEYVEGVNNPNAVFRAHFPPGNTPRPLVVLVMGNGQGFQDSETETGMIALYNRLRERGDVNVVLFRVGNANPWSQMGYSQVLSHTQTILQDIIAGRGMFQGQPPPTNVVMAGYSWGGGTVRQLAGTNWQNIGGNIPISATAILDGITLGGTTGVSTRPESSEAHYHRHQREPLSRTNPVRGATLTSPQDDDFVDIVEGIPHNQVDDQEWLIDEMYEFLDSALRRY